MDNIPEALPPGRKKVEVRMMLLVLLVALVFLVSACQPAGNHGTIQSPSPGSTQLVLDTSTPTSSSPASPTPTSNPTSTPTATETPLPSATLDPGPSPTATITIPEGTVLQQSACRYGPGAAYLFEWGLYPGDYVKILHRNWDGTWLDVKPDTYKNGCWVRADLLDVRGNIFSLEYHIPPLPFVYTRLYEPVRYVIAIREGSQVTVEWEAIWMTEDDDRGYLIEAWVCLDGNLTFQATDYHPWTTTFGIIRDEGGCSEPSRARFYTVEKHGYMEPWVDINWPAYPPFPVVKIMDSRMSESTE
ncbi:hypothetical protein ACFLXB_03265 [Chloroflexota bacterium]